LNNAVLPFDDVLDDAIIPDDVLDDAVLPFDVLDDALLSFDDLKIKVIFDFTFFFKEQMNCYNKKILHIY
jgi:hypothetical protein